VIVLDVKLPKIDGFEVLRALKSDSRTRFIPVVMLTSSNIDRDVARAYELGANSYVQKAVDFERFRQTVRQLAIYWMTMNEPPPSSPFGNAAAK
jgi:two-component system response regulator